MTSIDDLLKPYEDEQPPVSMISEDNTIERIPNIVNPATGQVTDEFQKFYNKVVEAITTNDEYRLHLLSDKTMIIEDFVAIYSPIKEELRKVLSLPKANRGIDIELNLQRFKEKHRNLVGGFFIMTYTLEPTPYVGIKKDSLDFEQKYTEILFTYKFGQFSLISNFKPFVTVEN